MSIESKILYMPDKHEERKKERKRPRMEVEVVHNLNSERGLLNQNAK